MAEQNRGKKFATGMGQTEEQSKSGRNPQKRRWQNRNPQKQNPVRRDKMKGDRREEDEAEEKEKKRIRICAVLCILAGCIGLVIIIYFACRFSVIGRLLDFWAQSIITILVVLIEIAVGAISIYEKQNMSRGKRFCFMIVSSGAAAVWLLASALKLLSLILDATAKPATIEPQPVAYIVESQQTYQKAMYSMEDDIFVEKIYAYCGIEEDTLSEEECLAQRANIIRESMEKSVDPDARQSKPQSFVDNWDLADDEYRVYLYRKGMDTEGKSDNVLTKEKEKRLEDLESAKNYRILADYEYQDADNQRLITLYCIDSCDEYLQDNETDLAVQNLYEAAEWAVKSINSAAVFNDKGKMEEALKELKKAADRLEDLQGVIGDENIKKIIDCKDAYEKVISEWGR